MGRLNEVSFAALKYFNPLKRKIKALYGGEGYFFIFLKTFCLFIFFGGGRREEERE